MRFRAFFVATAVVVSGAASVTCSHTQYAEPAEPDGSNESAIEDTYVVPDTFDCDPCDQQCSCTPGDTYFNPGQCATVTCGASGLWGGSCLGLGCEDSEPPETGPETGGPSDAAHDGSDAAMTPGDAGTDGSPDATDAASADAENG
jgi:hypothetical protein